MLKNPPYSKQFCSQPYVWIFIGADAWNKAKTHNPKMRLVLPPDENISDYNWKIIKNCIVFCMVSGETDISYRQNIAYELFKSGAENITFLFDPIEIVDYEAQALSGIEYIPNEYYDQSDFMTWSTIHD